jgi:cell division protein FtsL
MASSSVAGSDRHLSVVREEAAESPRAARPRLELHTRRQLRLRRRRGVLACLVVLTVFALLFGIVAMQVLIVQTQRRIDAADQRIAAEQLRSQRYESALAVYESPGYVLQRAAELGMVRADSPEYLHPAGDDALAIAAAMDAAERAAGAHGEDGPP